MPEKRFEIPCHRSLKWRKNLTKPVFWRFAAASANLTEFYAVDRPMIDEAELLAVKIKNLRLMRDLLLPRLLSGLVELETKAA